MGRFKKQPQITKALEQIEAQDKILPLVNDETNENTKEEIEVTEDKAEAQEEVNTIVLKELKVLNLRENNLSIGTINIPSFGEAIITEEQMASEKTMKKT